MTRFIGSVILLAAGIAGCTTQSTPIVTLDQVRSETAREQGLVFAQQGNYSEALSCMNQAVMENRQNAKAYRDRARILMEQQQYDDALDDLNKAIELDPDDPVPFALRAEVFHAKGRDELARADEARWEELDPIPDHVATD